MKKFYEKAEMEVVEFSVDDVITTSEEVSLPEEPSDPVEVPGDEF